MHSACAVARSAWNDEKLTFTNFPERDDVKWTKHILSRLDAQHVDDAEVVLEYREVIRKHLDDQMRHVSP